MSIHNGRRAEARASGPAGGKRKALRIQVLGGIGDTLMFTPLISAWRRNNPGGRLIVYCVEKYQHETLRGNPHIDSLRLRGRFYRKVLTRLPPLLRRVLRGVFRPSYALYLYDFQTVHAAQILGALGGIFVANVTPELYLTAAEREAARHRLLPFRTPVAVHTSAAYTATKEWRVPSWAGLVASCPDIDFIQLGARSDPLIPGVRDFRGLPLRESFAVLGQCRAFVGIDSGPAHAAAALGVPRVVLWGPTVPEVLGYPSSANLSVRRRCSPCLPLMGNGRCFYGRACMDALTVPQVREALNGKLAEQA
jgi:hypothetical protein